MDDHLILLDGLFAEDPTLRLSEYVCLAMLERIRSALLASDYSSFLQLLLRYPALADGTFKPEVLLAQAIFLRDNCSAEAGRLCREQNVAEGTVAGHGEGAEEENTPRRRSQVRPKSMVGPGLAISGLLGEGGLLGDAVKGVYGRAEALGILGAVNELRVCRTTSAHADFAKLTLACPPAAQPQRHPRARHRLLPAPRPRPLGDPRAARRARQGLPIRDWQDAQDQPRHGPRAGPLHRRARAPDLPWTRAGRQG